MCAWKYVIDRKINKKEREKDRINRKKENKKIRKIEIE